MQYYEVVPRGSIGSRIESFTYHSANSMPLGTLVSIEVGTKLRVGIVWKKTVKPTFPTKSCKIILDEPLPKRVRSFLSWISLDYCTALPTVLIHAVPANIARRPKNTSQQKPDKRPPLQTRHLQQLSLTKQQLSISRSIAANTGLHLLHGDTGSGKTLIYREVIKEVLKQGRSVIVLVPEIGLTPQLAQDLTDLSTQLFIMHSQLSEVERRHIWLKLLQQKAPVIIVGSRSSLFAPLANVGLIIVDEAHETSYKQDSAPHFHAVPAAIKLGLFHNAIVVIGSATPRIIDRYFIRLNSTRYYRLPRYAPIESSNIHVVALQNRDNFSISRNISNILYKSLQKSFVSGRQSLLYINRRGTSLLVACSACSWQALCNNCDIPLVHHQDLQKLVCHTCGSRYSLPITCPECDSDTLLFTGAGTKRIVEELQRLFPQAQIARIDTDTEKTQRLTSMYDEIARGSIDIIVGTQAVARGLDLPKLDTVGVILADTELRLPDYASSERAFQLLYQVMGRAGRTGAKTSTIVVQTYDTNHPSIRHALAQDYDAFYRYELAVRLAHLYPPYVYLLHLTCKYASRSAAVSAATTMRKLITEEFSGIEVLGPAPAFHERAGQRFRWTLTVKSKNRGVLKEIALMVRSHRQWQFDIDPINLLS